MGGCHQLYQLRPGAQHLRGGEDGEPSIGRQSGHLQGFAMGRPVKCVGKVGKVWLNSLEVGEIQLVPPSETGVSYALYLNLACSSLWKASSSSEKMILFPGEFAHPASGDIKTTSGHINHIRTIRIY